MAPLTRVRGTERFVCAPTATQYYGERATKGGLIITEGAPVSPETQYEHAAGIYTPEQQDGWAKVVDAVHEKGGKISLQLWHLGRMCHGSWANHPFLQSLNRPLPSVSCSATTPPGKSGDVNGQRGVPHLAARELSAADIRGRLVEDFAAAAAAAKRAGFDFVEVHAAHGYLFDQFFCDSTNLREDEFGAQSIENRTRALGLVLQAVIKEMGGSDRVGIRVSPTASDSWSFQGCADSNPQDTYRDVVSFLNQFDLAYLLVTEQRWNGGRDNRYMATDTTYKLPIRNDWVSSVYDGTVIGSSSFTPASADAAIAARQYDAVAFGRFFISNPDFVERVLSGGADPLLNEYDTRTFYVRDPVLGYVDYPTAAQAAVTSFPQMRCSQIGEQRQEEEGGAEPPPAAKL